MNWELKEVGETKWVQDNSGYYALIHYIKIDCRTCERACIDCIDGHVRLDFMDKDDMPFISYQGTADDVRKYIMQNWPLVLWPLSIEHASYIGAELARCELQKTNYVQD
ncbi:hypothetical protein LCGC14_0598230 [marine sediment metagenome]|uniref:Uncharacterized protein n=1 Tax=marine sediment metagenome TaxID=412755 RepID=A0A0F9RGA9_9ZZZZ